MTSVAVVIPCRNRLALLQRALASVEAQTAPPTEILIADDASDPPLASLLPDHPRVRFVRLDDRVGAAAARNAAVAATEAEWIAFLDSDDTWEPTRLERQMEALARHGESTPDVGYCLETLQGNGGVRREPVIRLEEEDVFRHLVAGARGSTSTVMLRRSAFQAVNGFDPELSSAQDADLLYRLALAGYRFSAVNEPLAVWYEHDGAQISHDLGRRWTGFRRLDRKWRKPILERLGWLAYLRWKASRIHGLRRLALRADNPGHPGLPVRVGALCLLTLYQVPFSLAVACVKRLRPQP